MHSLTVFIVASLLSAAVAVVCIALVLRRRGDVGVRCSLELTPQDGWRLLNLAVANRLDAKIWVERAAFVITDLDASMQSGPASGLGSVEIREFIRSREDLHVSLIEAVYNAAGKPQGVYSFVFNCTIRYRLGERWLESESPVFRVEMVRLSASRVRRAPAAKTTTRAAASTAVAQSPLATKEAPGGEQTRTSKPESIDALRS